MINKWGQNRIYALTVCGAVLSLLSAVVLVCVAAAKLDIRIVYAAAALGLLGALLGICAASAYKKAGKIAESELEMLRDTAFISFDKASEKASVSGAFADLTGIETGSKIIGKEKYSDVMREICSGRYPAENNIYMSAVADKWIRVKTSSSDDFEFTEISDVTDYVVAKNTINSLRNFDASSGLMTKETFMGKLVETAAGISGMYGLIHITISGVDQFSSFAGLHNSDEMFSKAAAIVKRYENPHNIFAGRASVNDFSVLITETYEDGCKKLAGKITTEIKEMIADYPGNGSIAKVYCGYALASGSCDVSALVAQADFAAFDAEDRRAQQPVIFNADNYSLKAQEFRRNQVFETIIGEDCIDYHFQPIVNAHTGEIYGYEALMRPQSVDGIKLSPLDVLDIAKQMDMLYSVEHITFWKTLKILSENQDFFHNRKLFINCIPNALLSDEEYNDLSDKYGMLFDKLVVEVTEENPVFESAVNVINKRYREKNAQIALDDYGTGYSNDSTLLAVKPSCIKIDRSIMSGIDKNPQKQHLVANMINFAAQHEIMVLGEGIETFEELETAIALGVDLVQGYVVCRPTAVLMLEIPSEIKNRIISFNIKHRGKVSKTYYIKEQETADIVELSLAGFNEICIQCDSAKLVGNTDVQVEMKIMIEEKRSSARVVFENINIICNEDNGCAVVLMCDTKANIELVGRNCIRNGGIRVPDGTEIFFGGEGGLEINNTKVYSFGIGGNYMQRYGRILFGGENNIKISCSGDSVVGIGGAEGLPDSTITANSGDIALSVDGKNIVAIGSYNGSSSIKLNECDIRVDMGGDDVTAIGSRMGRTVIDSLANLSINISGNNCCGIGVLRKGEGSIIINGSKTDILVRGKDIVGIGTVNGNVESVINAGVVNIRCEGNNATCIGDIEGKGAIRLRGASITAIAKASVENPIGSKDGRIYVTSGSIETSDVEPLECYSLAGEKLVRKVIDGTTDFRKTVRSGGDSYIYIANKTGEETMNIYLPASEA
ncbi:MAG: EAL domain-containing protein [Oscillospiraceae bacterium]